MARDKIQPQSRLPTRERILDASERLLSQSDSGFSMRELADEAGVSFATPFNQFGSKGAIMLALSERRIVSMRKILAEVNLPQSAVARVLAAVDIAASVMLASPDVSRAVMGAIGAPSDILGEVSTHSSDLWSEALGTGDGLAAVTRSLALASLPAQLAVAFRGVLSFWTAGEFTDQVLSQRAREAAATVLLGFAGREDRSTIVSILEDNALAKRHA